MLAICCCCGVNLRVRVYIQCLSDFCCCFCGDQCMLLYQHMQNYANTHFNEHEYDRVGCLVLLFFMNYSNFYF